MKQGGDEASVIEEEVSVADVETSLKTVVNEFLADPVNFKAKDVLQKSESIQEAVEKGHDGSSEYIKNFHCTEEKFSVRLNNSLNYSLFSKRYTV